MGGGYEGSYGGVGGLTRRVEGWRGPLEWSHGGLRGRMSGTKGKGVLLVVLGEGGGGLMGGPRGKMGSYAWFRGKMGVL